MKYGNRKTNGYDSAREAKRAAELKLLERAGKIRFLREQERFELIPKQTDENGKIIEKACHYIADFAYIDAATGAMIVEDSKGFKTKDYIIKRKLMLYRYGIRIREV